MAGPDSTMMNSNVTQKDGITNKNAHKATSDSCMLKSDCGAAVPALTSRPPTPKPDVQSLGSSSSEVPSKKTHWRPIMPPNFAWRATAKMPLIKRALPPPFLRTTSFIEPLKGWSADMTAEAQGRLREKSAEVVYAELVEIFPTIKEMTKTVVMSHMEVIRIQFCQ